MKKTRYSDEQIVRVLRETDKDTIAAAAKRHGVSEASIYAWKKKFGRMEAGEVKRLRALESENSRLRKLLVDWELEIEVMKEINAKVGAGARLERARYAQSRGVSQRRACALMSVSRSGLYYHRKIPEKDSAVIEVMKDLSRRYPRFGSRRIRIFLEREGFKDEPMALLTVMTTGWITGFDPKEAPPKDGVGGAILRFDEQEAGLELRFCG